MQRGWAVRLAVAGALCLGAIGSAVPAQAYWYGNPENLAATDLGGGRTLFTWTPPNRNVYRGTEPSSYRASVTAGSRTYTCDGSASYGIVYGAQCIVSGLPYGVPVSLKVEAWEPYWGDDIIATFVLCCEVPKAPASVAATGGNGTASVSWAPPANAAAAGGTFTYAVEMQPGGPVCTTNANSCDVGGLANGIAYTFYVSAANKSGKGPAASSAAVTPSGPPTEPLAVQAFLQKAGALVAWQGPASTGGAPITRYVVVSSPDNLTCETAGELECVVAGLVNGTTYTFTVTAFNAVGQSQASAASEPAQMLNVPASPIDIRATRRGSTVSIAWKAPKSTGGTKLSEYLVTSSPGNRTCTTRSSTTCRISGLAAGQSYVFSVQARNAVGLSAPGRSAAVVIPAPAPAPVKPEAPLS